MMDGWMGWILREATSPPRDHKVTLVGEEGEWEEGEGEGRVVSLAHRGRDLQAPT